MTKAIHKISIKDDTCSNISSHLKEDYGAISDHLRNHVHLTNCIHLKNHMHRRSPNFAERSFMRDLIVLQKSRSLRDPSTSPQSWVSPYIMEGYARKAAKDGYNNNRRRSIGVDRQSEVGRLSISSPLIGSAATAKVTALEAASHYDMEERDEGAELTKGEEHGRRGHRSNSLSRKQASLKDTPIKVDTQSRREPHESTNGRIVLPMTLPEQSGEVQKNSDFQNGRNESKGKANNEPAESVHDHYRRSKRGKKFRLRGTRRGRSSIADHRNLNISSNSVAQVPKNQNGHLENVEEDTELEAAQTHRNVCGIRWNWSRIHHRGKTFLDVAGRSLSCGISDSRMKKADGTVPQRGGNTSNVATASDHLTPSMSSDSEVLPLLIEGPESQDNGVNHFLSGDYSGELEIFSNHSLRHTRDSDLASEATSGQRRYRRYGHGRHKSLTQKYMPKTFKDIVGQNLVVQALSNAILRRKVGLIYVFYGPHGTGKTSCARVFAKTLNCLSVEVPKPCDVCSSCISTNQGKSIDVLEVGSVGNFDSESIKDVFDNAMLLPRSSLHRVLILDDCDDLPSNLWSTISKVIDRAPRHVIFVLICSNLDCLPHIIISRCQKFFFPKVRDSDIISTLQRIANSEGLEIEKEALKLIASRSDGSLRDAEMTLDQLSLLGKKISLPLVQELVGLVSDEKLVDLLDLALSADTVNTVKSLRDIMETGVDPLALMSQLATIITDILAGSYEFTRERLRRKFFRKLTLSKEDMERLRQALRALSEAEKQLRVSSDKLTWLTAALLQLAPDQQYMLPGSSTERSVDHSPLIVDNHSTRHMDSTNKHGEIQLVDPSFSRGAGQGNNKSKGNNDVRQCIALANGKAHGDQTSHNLILCGEAIEASDIYNSGKRHIDTEKIWQAVLEHIPSDTLKQFLYHEGNLISVSIGAAPTVQLAFSSNANRSRAEKFRGQILQAFESVLASPVILELRCKSRNSASSDVQAAALLPSSDGGSSKLSTKRQQFVKNQNFIYSGTENLTGRLIEEKALRRVGSSQARWLHPGPHVMTEDDIIEVEPDGYELTNMSLGSKDRGIEHAWEEASTSQHHAYPVPSSERNENEQNQRKSLVRGKVSLAHVIQRAEGRSQQGGWSRRKAMSIADKLEQENLRLEARSRSLFCWKASRTTRSKIGLEFRGTPSIWKLVVMVVQEINLLTLLQESSTLSRTHQFEKTSSKPEVGN
ncbi:protein STICHEL-like 3 [Canna indica]|uniref:Protein STICHEL-like 3 n=1 Tax=Canna indica TaxID=4628 RepID=A0AAQ3KW73_9LILI|nr:protein STICHEL-like 3 [Canna indica]